MNAGEKCRGCDPAEGFCKDCRETEANAKNQPAGAADTAVSASIDTPEFRKLLDEFAYRASERRAMGGDFGSAENEEIAESALIAYIDSRATQPVQAVEAVDDRGRADFIEQIVLGVAEIDGRDSPEDQPEMMLVTPEELRAIVVSAFETADEARATLAPVAAQQAAAKAPAAQAGCEYCEGGFIYNIEHTRRIPCLLCRAASPASTPEASQQAKTFPERAKWTTKQWYEHVGAWETPEGYISFGSVMALGAMLIQFQRTFSAAPAAVAATTSEDVQRQAPSPQQSAPASAPETAGVQGDKAAAADAAVQDVLVERRRQIEVEGWTPEHDDKYTNCELARAAATYATCSHIEQLKLCGEQAWPWHPDWWKRGDYRRDLVKAGALILAEIERVDRDRAAAVGAGGQAMRATQQEEGE